MIRNPTIRRLIIGLLLLIAPLTQFQTLYACELMEHDHEHERPSMICCCDEPGHMGKKMDLGNVNLDKMDMNGCDIDGTCQDQAGKMAGQSDLKVLEIRN